MKYVRMLNDQGQPYPSYGVLQRLVELSGLPWIDQTELDLQVPETYLLPMINGNSLAWARSQRRCKFYCWQIERWLTTAEEFAPQEFDQLWIADRYQAKVLQSMGRNDVRYVPIGGHPGLGGKPGRVKIYDLAVMAYLYGRRQALLAQIAAQGWSIAPNAFGAQRDLILSESRCGLSLHQWNNDPSLNPLRAVLFTCWKLPLIFERVEDEFPFLAYGLHEIPAAMVDEGQYAQRNYDLLTGEMSFRRCVEAAL